MLVDETTRDVFDEVRDAVRLGAPWSYWAAPRTQGTLTGGLVTIEFPRGSVAARPPETYQDSVRQALKAIDAGRVEKVVVAREEKLGAADVASTLRALRRRFAECWVFATSDGTTTFLGATPELLARFDGRRLETCALAGTAAPGDDSLLTSAKDLHEHRLVIDAITDSLAPFCSEVRAEPAPTLMVLPNVQHLRTPIRATLRDGVLSADVVRALHPTPAVCGTPRAAARQVIGEIESFDRGLYAGVVGHGDEFVVAIRSARLTPDATYVYAGAGIVAGSDPDAEDAETRAKLLAVTDALRFR